MSKLRSCSRLPKPVTHAAIVADYLVHHKPRLAAELAWFAERQSPRAALARVTAAKDWNEKRLPHQWRLLRSVSPNAFAALSRVLARLMVAPDFSSLHREIENALRVVPGSGPLFLYDTALRFGAYRDIFPIHVYIHAGTKEGATRALRRPPKLIEPITAFPPAFGSLQAHELENLLCCYRECV